MGKGGKKKTAKKTREHAGMKELKPRRGPPDGAISKPGPKECGRKKAKKRTTCGQKSFGQGKKVRSQFWKGAIQP